MTGQNIQDEIDQLRERLDTLRAEMATSFLGQHDIAELLLLSLLAGGHALLEGAPGLGKTTLVRSLADSLALGFRRVQFTPDLMPADILGSRILKSGTQGSPEFTFERGPVFTQILLADEVNRATPRTQSALLEAMQERQVTIYGKTLPLEQPFQVIATQNPIEMEGTYPLPEAQLDRFLVKIQLHLPPRKELQRILEATTGSEPEPNRPVLQQAEVCRIQALVRDIPVSDDILAKVAALVHATHPGSDLATEQTRKLVRFGSSPRGGQALLLMAKARALVAGRLHVTGDDIASLAAPCLRHRLILGYEADATGTSADAVVEQAWAALPN